MKQTSRIISTYSADVMGVCSALFELGGMTIMHDASGCNSTYTTHDEPRWYDMDSMVYISGLTEMEAIMGDDGKILGDIEDAVRELHPKFVAIAGTPIPAMTGVDFESLAALAEQRTGVPCMGFPTTGMNTYIHGASMAFAELARRFVKAPSENAIELQEAQGTQEGSPAYKAKANIIGLTPLDFSVNGQAEAIKAWLEDEGYQVISTWGMGCALEDIERSGEADMNLVVSASGLAAAEYMREQFGIPYVTGIPIGGVSFQKIASSDLASTPSAESDLSRESVVIIGEAVSSLSLANAIERECALNTGVFCATEIMGISLRDKDLFTPDEEDIKSELDKMTEVSEEGGISAIIADPLYQPICPPDVKFIRLPSEAFSGRLYRSEIPNLVTNPEAILDQLK